MIAVANAPNGTRISGPMSTSPHGAGAVCGYGKLYLRSTSQRTGSVHGSVVCPDRLPRDRQAKPGAPGFVRHVRLPDSLETVGGDALAVVGHRDAHRISSLHLRRFCRHRDAAALSRSIDRVE